MKSEESAGRGMTLDAVRREFDRWRVVRSGRSKTPTALRRRAVAMLDQHCAFHVCRALGINATALKRWAGEHEHDVAGGFGEAPAFVSLDAEPSPDELHSVSAPTPTLTLELPHGIRIHCGSADAVVELLEALRERDARVGYAR